MRWCGGSLAVLLGAVVALMPGGAAHAEEPTEPIGAADIVSPGMSITLTPISGGTRVCADATVAAAGSFSVGVNGVRSDATQISAGGGSAPVTTYHYCADIWKKAPGASEAAGYGTFYVYFVFQGGSNSTVTVRPGGIFGTVAWSPFHSDTYVKTTGG